MSHAAIALGLVLALTPVHALAQDADQGGALFQWYCASCHGVAGDGAGPMAPVLLVQPTDLTKLSASSDGEFPLLRVVRRIDGSDPLVSHGSDMPVFGPLFQGNEVALKTAAGQPVLMGRAVADLVLYLQEIQE
ncbi:MAG: c-type cytochrome [Rhodobacterales bacterium]|nr:c-type cytochrome [Rhodobacterales bacterium]MDX5414529.1 c-type cytochrome [Rhodobacterales bacterium]